MGYGTHTVYTKSYYKETNLNFLYFAYFITKDLQIFAYKLYFPMYPKNFNNENECAINFNW